MKKFKQKVVLLLGLFITKLKSHTATTRVVNYLRTSCPGMWGAISKKLRPFYWRYQASKLDEAENAFFKDMSAFKEQHWHKSQSLKRAHADVIQNGVMNNRPIVDAAALLEKISRSIRPLA